MIRELKPARWVSKNESGQDIYVREVAVDSTTELSKLVDNTAHGSVAEVLRRLA